MAPSNKRSRNEDVPVKATHKKKKSKSGPAPSQVAPVPGSTDVLPHMPELLFTYNGYAAKDPWVPRGVIETKIRDDNPGRGPRAITLEKMMEKQNVTTRSTLQPLPEETTTVAPTAKTRDVLWVGLVFREFLTESKLKSANTDCKATVGSGIVGTKSPKKLLDYTDADVFVAVKLRGDTSKTDRFFVLVNQSEDGLCGLAIVSSKVIFFRSMFRALPEEGEPDQARIRDKIWKQAITRHMSSTAPEQPAVETESTNDEPNLMSIPKSFKLQLHEIMNQIQKPGRLSVDGLNALKTLMEKEPIKDELDLSLISKFVGDCDSCMAQIFTIDDAEMMNRIINTYWPEIGAFDTEFLRKLRIGIVNFDKKVGLPYLKYLLNNAKLEIARKLRQDPTWDPHECDEKTAAMMAQESIYQTIGSVNFQAKPEVIPRPVSRSTQIEFVRLIFVHVDEAIKRVEGARAKMSKNLGSDTTSILRQSPEYLLEQFKAAADVETSQIFLKRMSLVLWENMTKELIDRLFLQGEKDLREVIHEALREWTPVVEEHMDAMDVKEP